MAATIKALAAVRAAQREDWEAAGCRSAAEALARQTGTTVGTARDVLDTGRRLEQHPSVASAARAGELSAEQTTLICQGADADPVAAEHLVQQAKGGSSLGELRNEVARVKSAAADQEARYRQAHQRRRLRSWTDVEGVWHLRASGTPDAGALIMTALAPITDEIFHAARHEGRREPLEAYAFDALLQLAVESISEGGADAPDDTEDPGAAAGPAAGAPPAVGGAGDDRSPAAGRPTRRRRRARRGPPFKMLVRIDCDSWLRGVALPGETCELPGYGSVPVCVVQALVDQGDPFVAAILAKGKRLVGVAHLGRRPNAMQQSALEWLYPHCANERCQATARLQADHRIDWAKTHHTMLDELDLLCSHDHALKTRSNWSLVPGIGRRAFVPPDDPRHPGYGAAQARGQPPAA